MVAHDNIAQKNEASPSQLIFSFPLFKERKKEIGIDSVLSEIGFRSFCSYSYIIRGVPAGGQKKVLEVGERVWYECGILMQGLYWCLSGPGLR